jgi:peptidoglycan/xylan/chitin deacetylase (PgdA/CDA1 family)
MVNNKALSLLLAAAGSVMASPIAQPSKRALPTGQLIYGCTQPGVVALTFDDGPYAYTSQALDLLDAAGFKGTFFLNGQNWGSIYDYSDVVARAYSSGHQIGSHTWSHADLGTLDAAGVTSQMTQLEDALVSIIGVYGTYLRAPYLSTSGVALSTVGSRGYHVIDISIDTKDYELQSNIPQALANFQAGLNAGGTISLEHDVHQFTVQSLLPLLISELQSRGLRGVTVGECLGDPSSNWYAAARDGSGGGGGDDGGDA